MADDYSDNAATSGRILPGGTVTGSLETGGDDDWFAISLTAGYDYQFSVSGTASTISPTNLNVRLADATGTVLVGNPYAANKSINYVPTTTGVYYVDVGANSTATTGQYQLTAAAQDDFTNTAATSGRILPGQTIGGGLQATNDADWFAITMTAGYNYQFTLSGTASTISPTALNVVLLDNTGAVLVGSPYGANKTMTYTPTATGTYYVEATSNTGQTFGTYTLSASPQDDYAANGSTTGRLTGTSISGALEGANDVDWIAVQLNAGLTYGFTIAGTASTVSPTGLNLGLLNGTGTNVAGAGGYYSTTKSVTYTPTSSGTYYLQASSYNGGSLGGYVITENSVGGSTGSGGGTSTGGGATGGATGSGSGGGSTAATSTPAPTPVYRFFDSLYGTHFFTSDPNEFANIIANRPDLKSEGVGLEATSSSDPNAAPVYRFFDSLFGTHFFTSDATERDSILSNRPDLKFEGVGFYEYKSQQAGTTPVYRYFDSIHGTHFFTNSAAEVANIAAGRPDLKAEGIAFYAPS